MEIFAALFSTSLSLVGNLGLHYLSKEQQVQEQRYLFLLVCIVYLCATDILLIYKDILYTLIGIGSAALAPAVPYSGNATPNFQQGTKKY